LPGAVFRDAFGVQLVRHERAEQQKPEENPEKTQKTRTDSQTDGETGGQGHKQPAFH